MSSTTPLEQETLEEQPSPLAPISVRLSDLSEMTKPGITLMVVLTAGLGFLLAERRRISFLLLVYTLLGTGLVSAGASVLNHVLEREHRRPDAAHRQPAAARRAAWIPTSRSSSASSSASPASSSWPWR